LVRSASSTHEITEVDILLSALLVIATIGGQVHAPTDRLEEVAQVMAELCNVTPMAAPRSENSSEYREIILVFNKIGRLSHSEVEELISRFLLLDARKSRNLFGFKLYSLYRYICAVPFEAHRRTYVHLCSNHLRQSKSELWPWTPGESGLKLVGYCDEMNGLVRYDSLEDFRYLVKTYGRRALGKP
jgi:hypothetical protein